MFEKTLRWIAIVGIFCLPFIVLIVARSLFFPYITGKNFTFRILVEAIGGIWLALALVYPRYRPRRSWLLLAFTIFTIAIFVADIFGVNPAKSIWSNYERMDGWVTLAHLFVFFLAASSLFTEEIWKRWWQSALGVSVLVGFHGLFQYLGIVAISTQSGARLDATFGNATYLGVYMLFHVFIAVFLLANDWTSRKPGARTWVPIVYGSIILLDTFVLFFTATRGAILGLIGGAALAALLLFIRSPRAPVARYAGATIALLIVLSGGFWLVRDSAFVKSSEPLARLASISISERTITSRFMNVGMAWQGFKERPLLGWGQENYAVVFDKYYNPEMYAQEPWFDRVHNIVFDWLVAGGLIGLLAYLALYATALLALWRSSAFPPIERSIISGLLAGYFFYLLFTFDNIMSYLMFAAVLAYIASKSSQKNEVLFAKSALPKKTIPFVALGAVVLVWGTTQLVNADALATNRTLIFALSSHQDQYQKNLEYFKQALAYDSFGTQEAREHLSQAASGVANPALKVSDDVRGDFLKTATDQMAIQMRETPLNARFPFFLGILLDAAGQYADGQKALEKAHELSPKKQSILFELGVNAFARGDAGAAVNYFQEAYNDAPEYTEALMYLVAADVQARQIDRADALTQKIIEAGAALDQRILSAYAQAGRFDKIADLARAERERSPQNTQAHLMLAAALYQTGDKTGAIQALEEMKRTVPSAAPQAESLIAQIQNGTLKVQ